MIREITRQDFQFGTEPYEHQLEAFNLSRDEIAYALLMEMGTGKTKVVIDTAAWLYSQGKIDALLIAAPNGVHQNWIKDEIPIHMPDWVEYRSAAWASYMRKAETQRYERVWDIKFSGLRIASYNLEAFGVPEASWRKKLGKEIRSLLNSLRCLLVVDEASKIKTPGAKRTRRLITLGKYAEFRRILTGTPVTNGPLDIYAPFKFLGPELLGFGTFQSFKNRYAEWETERNWKTGKDYEVCAGYKHLDELTDKVAEHSYRKTKAECLDLPSKIYQRRYVSMTPEQTRIYNRLRDDGRLKLLTLDKEVAIKYVLVRYMRLQQVLGGFIPRYPEDATNDEVDSIFDDPLKNPRIKSIFDVADEASGGIVVWSRFQPELIAIQQALAHVYGKDQVVAYHGSIHKDERTEGAERFKAGDARFMVSQQQSGGYGHTWVSAADVFYYSNTFSLEDRLQSEDRTHRLGQEADRVLYNDAFTPDTVDEKIVTAFQTKKKLADLITQDEPSTWL